MASAPDCPRLMAVPSIVTAGPPAESMVPAMGNAEGFGVNVWPATVYALSGVYGESGRTTVELPIANAPDRPRLMTVPLTVIAGPSAEMVVPAIRNAEGFGVKI